MHSPTSASARHKSLLPLISLSGREQSFASMIWRHNGLSRRDLHERTSTHPNLTGTAVLALIESGLVREAEPAVVTGRGRPQIPLEIDPDRRRFVGLAIAPDGVRCVKVDARGTPVAPETSARSDAGRNLISVAAGLLKKRVDPSVFAIGVSITGLALPREGKILFSSALAGAASLPVAPIFKAAGSIPIVLNNDMHALSLRWTMTNDDASRDVLLVGVDDGKLGASLLLNGRPHRGAVSGANELGHTRLAVDTARCYCGQVGCLERILSSEQLARFGARSGRPLAAALAEPGGDAKAVDAVLRLFAHGIANAVNFVRPGLLIFASPLVRSPAFASMIDRSLPELILPGLRDRVTVKTWEQANVQSAENAAWLALAEVFSPPVNERE